VLSFLCVLDVYFLLAVVSLNVNAGATDCLEGSSLKYVPSGMLNSVSQSFA